MKNFWAEMNKALPTGRQAIFVLAPLANVTDAAFRRIIAKYSKVEGGVPYVTYTEFVSADGLALAHEEGRKKLMRDLVFSQGEHPIVAQFFTSNPGHMEKAAALAQELGFDGVDINMGCPDRSVEKQGGGAALIKNPERARELIRAAKRGAPNLPISVKTRLGYNKDELEEWLPQLLAENPAVITVHARTRKEMSLVPARWERVKRAVEIRDSVQHSVSDKTLIIGNGDLQDVADMEAKVQESGADGAMIGRGIFGTPWLFAIRQKGHIKNLGGDVPSGVKPDGAKDFLEEPSVEQRLKIAVEHSKLFEELLGDIKNFAIMKKHFKAYAEGFPNAKELRVELMETKNASEIEAIINKFLAL